MLAGVVITLLFWSRLAKRDERLFLIYLLALVGAFLGAKMVYFASEGWLFRDSPERWVIWATGKSILGALLGGYVSVELAKRLLHYRAVTGDWFAMIVPAGIIIGRVGCLFHGCCPGVPYAPAWYTMKDRFGVPCWPAVPVEIGFNALMILSFFLLRRTHRFTGQHFHLYLICYGTFRFLHEFARATPRILGPFSGYQIASLLVVLLGIYGFRRRAAEKARAAASFLPETRDDGEIPIIPHPFA